MKKTITFDDILWSIEDGKDDMIENALRVGEDLYDIYVDVSGMIFEKFGIIL